ncbi:MAG: hypothetical protein L0207_02830 [Chlamydiae bacterium]|nr:hypothetical protein [Chlamydiota bacterium]
MMKKQIWIGILFFLFGCQIYSSDRIQKKSEECCENILDTFIQIQSHDDLVQMESQLKRQFDELVELIIKAKVFFKKNPHKIPPQLPINSFNDALKEELMRIYKIEGGREVVERAQKEALIRLDGFLKRKTRD